MVNCDFCGKEILNNKDKKKEAMLNDGNYCKECSDKGINELYDEILDEECDKESDDEDI
jgi:hypothetical protein